MIANSHRTIAILAVALVSAAAGAQEPKLVLPRPSPYASIKQTVGFTDITVAYSSPAVRGRKIWGTVVPYDVVWRAGANESTKVTFSTGVTIVGKQIPAGTYSLFLLPTKAGWTFILNKDTTLWGADGYKASDDVLRAPATASAIPMRERLAYSVLDFTDDGGTLALEWDTTRVGVNFELGTRAKVLAEIHALKGDDWRPYNSAARYLLVTKLEPAYAMELVNKSIGLKEDWSNVWTKAQLLQAAGKAKEALTTAQRAQDLGKGSKNYDADEVTHTLAAWKQ
jgi:hypothetical protein